MAAHNQTEVTLIHEATEAIDGLIEQIEKVDYKDRHGNQAAEDPAILQLLEVLTYLKYYDQCATRTLQ